MLFTFQAKSQALNNWCYNDRTRTFSGKKGLKRKHPVITNCCLRLGKRQLFWNLPHGKAVRELRRPLWCPGSQEEVIRRVLLAEVAPRASLKSGGCSPTLPTRKRRLQRWRHPFPVMPSIGGGTDTEVCPHSREPSGKAAGGAGGTARGSSALLIPPLNLSRGSILSVSWIRLLLKIGFGNMVLFCK